MDGCQWMDEGRVGGRVGGVGGWVGGWVDGLLGGGGRRWRRAGGRAGPDADARGGNAQRLNQTFGGLKAGARASNRDSGDYGFGLC